MCVCVLVYNFITKIYSNLLIFLRLYAVKIELNIVLYYVFKSFKFINYVQ